MQAVRLESAMHIKSIKNQPHAENLSDAMGLLRATRNSAIDRMVGTFGTSWSSLLNQGSLGV